MRCSKVQLVTLLFIFNVIVVVWWQLSILFFQVAEDGHRLRSHLNAGLPLENRRPPELKTRNDTWISEIRGKAYNYSVSSEQRLNSVKQACRETRKSWDSLSVTEKQILGKHILVNDEHKFLFCSVPKAACTNWKRVITVLDGKANDSNAIEKVDHASFNFLADLPTSVAKHKLQEYYKFMFVREPLLRLISAYKDKFFLNHTSRFHKKYGINIVKHLRKNAPANSKGDDVTLKEFLQYVSESRVQDMNEHWMPFYELCQPCAVSYDFIGSFENLESDATQVLTELNVNELVSFPKQQEYYRAGGVGYAESGKFGGVSRDLMREVVRKYALDYKMFSYQMPA